jgi:hypothetical protein
MSAAWSSIHEDLNSSDFYLRVKQRAPIWQRLQKGGMFLAVIGEFVFEISRLIIC